MCHQRLKPSLTWFCLLLPMNFWYICKHIHNKIIIRVLIYHLSDTLILYHTFNISYSATNFYQTYLRCILVIRYFIINRLFGHITDPMLDRITNVWDHLHGLSEVIAFALFVNCFLEYASTGEVVLVR